MDIGCGVGVGVSVGGTVNVGIGDCVGRTAKVGSDPGVIVNIEGELGALGVATRTADGEEGNGIVLVARPGITSNGLLSIIPASRHTPNNNVKANTNKNTRRIREHSWDYIALPIEDEYTRGNLPETV
jgi:hypothetical protein